MFLVIGPVFGYLANLPVGIITAEAAKFITQISDWENITPCYMVLRAR
jgi:hypothetical protein